MSNSESKIKNSKRRFHDENAVKRQLKIAKSFGYVVNEPHRYVKHHALNCGNPNCFLCSNPRKTHKDKLTKQEKQMVDFVKATEFNVVNDADTDSTL